MKPARPRAEGQGSSRPEAGPAPRPRVYLLVITIPLLFELHVNTAASGVDGNAALCGGNANYHTGLI